MRSTEVLSQAQLDLLARHGEERTADAGDVLFDVGDKSYPFMAILEGEIAIRDQSGNDLIRHGPSGFVGELNLLTGQTVFLRAIVTEPMRYIAVDRIELRAPPLREPGPRRPSPTGIHRPARAPPERGRPGHRGDRPP